MVVAAPRETIFYQTPICFEGWLRVPGRVESSFPRSPGYGLVATGMPMHAIRWDCMQFEPSWTAAVANRCLWSTRYVAWGWLHGFTRNYSYANASRLFHFYGLLQGPYPQLLPRGCLDGSSLVGALVANNPVFCCFGPSIATLFVYVVGRTSQSNDGTIAALALLASIGALRRAIE